MFTSMETIYTETILNQNAEIKRLKEACINLKKSLEIAEKYIPHLCTNCAKYKENKCKNKGRICDWTWNGE